ncbi:MAG: LruC domain-containing protein, partial [Bacteroidales bacterium]|nr:LruC domain-containing protein [Bacteroidales bacterium]
NLKNGNNLNMPSIGVTGNPSLSCIQVDDPAWSEANWTNLDSQMYFSAFCGASGDDSDGDGVPDDFDDFPMDELRAFDNYFPAAGYGSLAYEDLWPGTGDYDFNDVVVDYRFEMVTNASNKVVEVFGSFVLKASGASLRNGFGFNLPAASTNLINNLNEVQVSGHHVTESFVSLLENGFEAGQSKPTIIVFDDFYNVMEHPGSGLGINTEPDKPFVEFDTLNVLIKPNEAIFGLSDFQFENWNPFIIVNNDRGREIHLADHAPTDLVDVSVFGSYEDSTDPSTGRYYKTSNNLPWAIHIIQEFVWPQEKISIVEAYHHFFEWANSSGTEFDDWYENHNGYRDDDKLYLHE